jgi:hypothetical protein
MHDSEIAFLKRLSKWHSSPIEEEEREWPTGVTFRRHTNGHLVRIVYSMECRPDKGYMKVVAVGDDDSFSKVEKTIDRLLEDDTRYWLPAINCHPLYLPFRSIYRRTGSVRKEVADISVLLYMMDE